MMLPIFYNNLDRRTDRRDYREAQLTAMGLHAERHSAVDLARATDADLLACVDLTRPRIHMTRQSACNAASHLAMHRRFLETGAPAALMLSPSAPIRC